MKHIWSVLCSRGVFDRESNNVSLQNVIEELTIDDSPKSDGFVRVPMDVVTLWTRDDPDIPEEGFARISFNDPAGAVLGQWELDVDLVNGERARVKIHFGRIPVRRSGIHTFLIEHRRAKKGRWSKAGTIPLKISFKEPLSEEEE